MSTRAGPRPRPPACPPGSGQGARWPAPTSLPLPAELLEPRHWVAEIVYFPLETELLRVARARGCRTLDGGGMAVFQAVEAFRLFTGITPDSERMTRHFASLGPG
jgi:shikimate dehydrogenase